MMLIIVKMIMVTKDVHYQFDMIQDAHQDLRHHLLCDGGRPPVLDVEHGPGGVVLGELLGGAAPRGLDALGQGDLEKQSVTLTMMLSR